MPDHPTKLVDHFFRHESANLVSTLTRVFGFSHLHIVEDMVQAALVSALHNWRVNGVPDNPSGWIHQVAKNKMIDHFRRETKFQDIALDLERTQPRPLENEIDYYLDESEIEDSLLRMMFVCCHPELDRTSQLAATLKILCGFSDHEIGRALLLNPEAARKRVYRAKSRIAELGVELNEIVAAEARERLESVHEVLYLMFNEGYHASSGERAIRDDLCEEATRLVHLLCTNSHYSNRTSHALLSLMLFHAARLESRVAVDGTEILLEEQDRSRWDQNLVFIGRRWFTQSCQGESVTQYHLEAGIALQHASANSFAETDWNMIVRLYDQLIEHYWSPIYVLNRSIALGQLGRAEEGIAELHHIARDDRMKRYVLLHCSLAYLYDMTGNSELAIEQWHAAESVAQSDSEKKFIASKLSGHRT